MYRWSKYNYTTANEHNVIIWNTYSGALLKMEVDFYNKIINNDLNSISPSDITSLIKNGFLLTDKGKAFGDSIAKIKPKKKVSFTIALTNKCNAQCYYCYQHNNTFSNKLTTSTKNLDNIANFIVNQSKNCKAIITWFGGEPLLKYNAIKYICKKLILNKVDFVSSIITNGAFMELSLMNEYNDIIHLKDIQITIDGLYEKHNKRKNILLGNLFEKVITLIYGLLDNEMTVRIRINISKYNLDEANEIFQYLHKCYHNYKKCYIYFALVSDDNNFHEFAFKENEREHILNTLYNKEYFQKTNYKLPKRRIHYCGKNSSCSHFIDIYGNIYMCEHDFWNLNKIIGTITELKGTHCCKIVDPVSLSLKCSDCTFLPVCQGGCTRNGYNECPAFIFRAKSYLKSLLELNND